MAKSSVYLPKTVRILGVPVRVKVADPEDAGDVGQMDNSDTLDGATITISPKLSQLAAEQTLFHELCHAVLHLSGHQARLGGEGAEESLVIVLEHVWRGLRAAGLAGSERGGGKGSRPRSRGRRKH